MISEGVGWFSGGRACGSQNFCLAWLGSLEGGEDHSPMGFSVLMGRWDCTGQNKVRENEQRADSTRAALLTPPPVG